MALASQHMRGGYTSADAVAKCVESADQGERIQCSPNSSDAEPYTESSRRSESFGSLRPEVELCSGQV